MKTLYVTDLDGTLLNKRDTISTYSLAVINSLVSKGMLFTYATARSLVSASIVTKGLSQDIPVIVYNGALIIYPGTGTVLSSITFSEKETEKVKQVLHDHKVSPLVYSYIQGIEKVSWDTNRENEGSKRYLSLRKNDKRMRPQNAEENLYDGQNFYYTVIGTQQELLPVYEIFSADPDYTCTLQQELYRPEYWCEIMPKKATKAEAIKQLKELWGCDRVISFGDAINDIPMFQISDECYAVENAVQKLKEIATGIIESNEKDGVAKWLNENLDFE